MSSEPGRSANRCGGLRVISCLIVIWIQSRSTSALFANHSCPVLGAGVSPAQQSERARGPRPGLLLLTSVAGLAGRGARAAPRANLGRDIRGGARGAPRKPPEARGEGHYSEAAHTSAHSRSHSTTRRYCYPRHAPNQHGSDTEQIRAPRWSGEESLQRSFIMIL